MSQSKLWSFSKLFPSALRLGEATIILVPRQSRSYSTCSPRHTNITVCIPDCLLEYTAWSLRAVVLSYSAFSFPGSKSVLNEWMYKQEKRLHSALPYAFRKSQIINCLFRCRQSAFWIPDGCTTLSAPLLWAKSLNVLKFYFHTLRNRDANSVYCMRLFWAETRTMQVGALCQIHSYMHKKLLTISFIAIFY